MFYYPFLHTMKEKLVVIRSTIKHDCLMTFPLLFYTLQDVVKKMPESTATLEFIG